MTPYKVIHLTADGVVGYRYLPPMRRNYGETPSPFIKDCGFNSDLVKWLSSGEKLEFANIFEYRKLFEYLNIVIPPNNVIDITNLVEYKCVSEHCHTGSPKLYFRSPVVEEENQTQLAGEIIALVKNHVGSGSALISIITKYKITRL